MMSNAVISRIVLLLSLASVPVSGRRLEIAHDRCAEGEFKYFETSALRIHVRTQRRSIDGGCAVVGIAIWSPVYKKGLKYLSIVTHAPERIKVYDGSNEVKFPKTRPNKRRKKTINGVRLEMTPTVILADYNLRVTLKEGATLRISENGDGTLSLGVIKWPEERDEAEGGLIQTYDDQDCYIHKEAVHQKEDSFFKDLTGSYDFTEFYFRNTYCSVTAAKSDDHCDDHCASFAFPGLKVLGRMAVVTARARQR